MGLIGGILERRGVTDQGTLANPGAWLRGFFGGGAAKSGVQVNEYNAETLSTVWCCVRSISEDVAKMPLKIYRRNGDDREEAKNHPASDLLNRVANDEFMTALTVRELLIRRALLWGNGIAEIERTNGGKPLALHPILPTRVQLKILEDGSLVYEVTGKNGTKYPLSPEDVLHIKGPSDDGYVGLSIVTKARESWGAAMAAEEFASRFWAQGARPSGVLQYGKVLSEKGMNNLRTSFNEQYTGAQNAGKPIVLEDGATWQATSIPPEDAQFLETRQFSVAEICRWFRFPPHKAGDLSRATFSNIEQQSKDYVDQCLSAWMLRFEQEVDQKLLLPREQGSFYSKHNPAALLRGDIKTRYEAYAIGRQWGFKSVNEIKRLEDENALPGEDGNQYLAPSNMTTPAKLAAAPAPAPPAPGSAKANDAPAPPAPPKADDSAARARERDAAIRCVVSAARPILEDALSRVLRVEADKAGRAQKQGKLAEWRDTFYADHAAHVKRDIFPVVECIAVAVGTMGLAIVPDDWAARTSSAIAERHVAGSRSALNGEDFEARIRDFTVGLEWKPAGRYVRDTSAALIAITDDLFKLAKEGPAS